MNARCCGLVSFLLEFIAAAVVVAVVIAVVVAVVVALLEFLVPLVPVVLVVVAAIVARVGDIAIAFAGFNGPETLDIGRVGEFQLAVGDLGEFALDSVVVYGLFMPVVVGQFHVIRYGVGKSISLFGILFRQGLIDDYLQIFAEVGKFRVAFGIFQRAWPGPQGFAGRDRIGGSRLPLEVGDQEKNI